MLGREHLRHFSVFVPEPFTIFIPAQELILLELQLALELLGGEVLRLGEQLLRLRLPCFSGAYI